MGGWFLSAIVTLALLGGVPATERGGGPAPREPESMLTAAKAAELAAIGDDVVRFSSAPALGGEGYLIELHRKDRRIRGTVTLLRGAPRLGYAVTGSQPVRLSAARYAALAKAVDALLDEAAGPVPASDLVVCADGPGHLTERRSPAGERWLAGSCGEGHPNRRVAALMRKVAGRAIGRAP